MQLIANVRFLMLLEIRTSHSAQEQNERDLLKGLERLEIELHHYLDVFLYIPFLPFYFS